MDEEARKALEYMEVQIALSELRTIHNAEEQTLIILASLAGLGALVLFYITDEMIWPAPPFIVLLMWFSTRSLRQRRKRRINALQEQLDRM